MSILKRCKKINKYFLNDALGGVLDMSTAFLRVLGIVLAVTALTSYGSTESIQQNNSTEQDPYQEMYDRCPSSSAFSSTMHSGKFKPIIISSNEGNTVVVWINFKSDETVYTLSNGHNTCTLFKGTHTLLNVPSGLTTI